MAETRLSDIDLYEGINPTVFKKVDTSDVTITPFPIYKTWTVTSGSSTSSCLPLNGLYLDTNSLPALGTELVYNDSKNVDNSLQTITYQSINHLFYKHKANPFNTFGPTDLNRTKKFLYQSASILSFPMVKVGEGIKPQSFELLSDNGGVYGTGIYAIAIYGGGIVFDLKSDRYGNIYDTQIPTSSIISGTKFYEGFNEYFDPTRISRSVFINGTNKRADRYITGSISFVPGVLATSGISHSIGLAAEFNQRGIMIVPNSSISGLYDRDHDYALSFFISASATGSATQMIIGKTGARKPYEIQLLANKRIRFVIVGSDPALGINDYTDPTKRKAVFVTATSPVTSSWNHVVCQKSGSYMQIYVNGSLQTSVDQSILKVWNTPFSQSMRIDSTGGTHIGGWNLGSATPNNYIGKLDEIRIYNKALTTDEIGYLGNRNETGSMLQTNVVGNVFAKQGLAVISSPNYIYDNILQTPYTASYKSTVTRYELSALVKADAGDFNMSLNNTLTADNDITYRGFVSGSGFGPYITTIGLYNDYGQLLAIGKLAQAVQKRPDVDMNFLVRIDLDKNIIPGEQ